VAEAGDIDAIYNLGVLLYHRGELGEVEAWFRRAAEAGNSDAMFGLGCCSRRGQV
jgi:TPR repeat protein